MNGMAARELELKLILNKDAFEHFRSQPIPQQMTSDPPKTRKLKSVYYDTLEHKLFGANMSLRVRRNGERWLQTVKCDIGVRHGVSEPKEVEQYVKGPVPDLDSLRNARLKKRLAKIISGEALQPVFETSIRRTTRNIRIPKTGKIELALDQGEIRAGGKTIDIQEVELELKSGRPHTLLSAAEALFSEYQIAVSERSKAQRGYLLLNGGHGPAESERQPSKGRRPELHKIMSGSEALCEIGRAAVDQILDNWQAVLASSDPEGPHQLRIGLRRFRTVLRILKPMEPSSDLDQLRRDARNLGRIVGRLRDADVLICDILEPACEQVSGRSGQNALREVLVTHREGERVAVCESLRSEKWSRLKLNCILFEQAIAQAFGPPRHEGDSSELVPIARRALKKIWRRVNKWGSDLDHLSAVERHEMRKDLKSLRYATEFFFSLFASQEARAFLKKLKRLQDVFGYLNDVALAERLWQITGRTDRDGTNLQQNVKSIYDWHATRADTAWNDAQQRWEVLAVTPRFWSKGHSTR
ncbi:MAG: CHAD domain-containing protein [Methyloligellaceae bacterium]